MSFASLTTLVWFRSDFRLADNPALASAAREGTIIPVFIYSPEEEAPWQPGGATRWWLHHSLKGLAASLESKGSRLILRAGPALETLLKAAKETGAQKVVWNRCYEPALIKRDTEIKARLKEKEIEAESFCGDLLVEPWKLKNKQGMPYKVYTPFSNQVFALPIDKPLAQPAKLNAPSAWPKTERLESFKLLPSIPWDEGIRSFWKPGEKEAAKQFSRFNADAVTAYDAERDRPDHAGTSRLAPYLHFGEISPRQIWHGLAANAKTKPYLRQIVWREFATHLLYHFPHTPLKNLRPDFDRFPWEKDRAGLKAWQKGRTGYPIVDAGMRELWTTGWMHNRVRMVVASFLVKDLMIPWQEGAKWFWDTLVDADLANNTMGWQWVAGSGADAAPYFRIFNPVSQGERFDTEAQYVRKWVPEVAALSDKWIHRPWEAPEDVLKKAGIILGKTYPKPIIDHHYARRRALAAYQEIKRTKQ